MRKNIALVAGGYSGEYDVSVRTASTIAAALHPDEYAVYTILLTKEGWTYTAGDGTTTEIDKNDFSLPVPEGRIRFDAAFIAIHGTPGEDGKLQGYFDMLGVPYTSCDAVVSALTFNKGYCNAVVRQSGLVRVARSVQIPETGKVEDRFDELKKLSFPLFVKPAEGGSSLGVTKLKSWDGLEAAVVKAAAEDSPVLVEEFINGRELTIGVYRVGGTVRVLPATEILSTNEFFDYEAKYTAGAAKEITPANLEAEDRKNLEVAAASLYDFLRCRGIVRFDFILERRTNTPYFLEVNTVPGQSEASIVPQQVVAGGSTLREFYGALLRETLSD